MVTEFLVKHFIKNNEETKNQQVRQQYGVLGGVVGIICNIILFVLKLIAGILTTSVAITADAFNNLSDAASSVVTLVGFKMAGKPADREHPFGHGRIEYIAGLIVSMVIILMGIEFIKSSAEKIISPEIETIGMVSIIILIFSILLKLWMSSFHKKLGKMIDSATMKATAMDSLSDVIATIAVLVGIVITYFTGVSVDGYAGIIVSLFIIYTGIMTAKETLDPLLGQAPDDKLVNAIEKKVLSYEGVVGVHDLIIHNYGPGRVMVTLHAEVPCDANILEMHDTIDLAERELKKTFGCEVTIHMDPIATDDELVSKVYQKVGLFIQEIDQRLTVHDFRMVAGPTHTNLIFDVVVPFGFHLDDEQLQREIDQQAKQLDETFETVVNIDKKF